MDIKIPEVGESPEGFDFVGAIMAYEMGEMDEDTVIKFFAYLVDSGFINGLQGHYGRMAQGLKDAGLI